MMTLTQEQKDIINSTGDIKINAVAGSGKTTTMIEYAASRPAGSKILYLAFNKSVKQEAIRLFANRGLSNVTVETAHSLAYRHIVAGSRYRIKSQDYKTHELVEMLKLPNSGEKHAEYIVANHINKFISYFCNSDKQRIQDLNYLDVVSDGKARQFVTACYRYIEHQTRLLLAMMDRAEIEITHDFYLKKFQLSQPVLHYDYILFDEGQDASQAMLDVFLKQRAVKVIVGDTHQQIYGWRHAVNSLERVNFNIFHLSTSFRFGQETAKLAMEILRLKKHTTGYTQIEITGNGNNNDHKTKAVLARTNLGLLMEAINLLANQNMVKHIYFEGNFHSYTYADDGASLYDVLNLYTGKRHLIRDKLILFMKNLEELEDYIEKTEDNQLGMMVSIVREYGEEIPDIIREIKEKHVTDNDRGKAELIFSTVHRSKGMEYDTVRLVNDFITEAKLEKIANDPTVTEVSMDKLNEEINMLYVAITRAKNALYIPADLVPEDAICGYPIRVSNDEEWYNSIVPPAKPVRKNTCKLDETRKKHANAYRPWTSEQDDELTVMYCENAGIKEMAKRFGRNEGAIMARIIKLELEEKYG